MEKLKIWYRIYQGEDEAVGPLIAGRLQGQAGKLAMNLKVPRPHGGFDQGDAALVRLAVDEVVDPLSGQVIQQHIPSGVQTLMNQLRATFGQQDQDLATQALERAFSLVRGKLSLPEYAAEFDQRMEEAADRAGLAVNDVGRFYLFFKNSGLAHRDIDSIKLQVGGDYTRYQDARALALRLANNKQYNEHDNFGGWASYDDEDPYSYDDWIGFGDEWQDDEWWSYDDDWYDPYYEDYMTYYEDDESWFWPEEEEVLSGQPEKEGVASSTQESREDHTQSTEDFYKGGGKMKGKGKGKSSDGCFICGSKYHFAADCPMRDNEAWRSKSGNQDWRSSYGKGVGKGKGKWSGKGYGRKGFGKMKGKGKGKYKGYGKKGKGFGKRSWYNMTSEKRGLGDFSDGIPDASSTMRQHHSTVRSTSATSATQRHTIHTSSSDEEFLTTTRRSSTTTNVETATAPNDKKLSFVAMFPSKMANVEETFFTVRGERRRGLIVDPGAASGLVGTETLRDIIESCVAPAGKSNELKYRFEKTTPVSGISGEADHTLGEVEIPLVTGGQAIQFTGEMIGGAGSLCPALVSNPALRKLRSRIFTEFFNNGDGLLVTGPLEGCEPYDMKYFRLLLTDSGHYILPTDDAGYNNKVSEESKKQVTLFCHQVEERSAELWPDVRRIFTMDTKGQQAEGNRGEMSTSDGTSTTFYDHKKKKDTKTKKVKFQEVPETKNYEVTDNEMEENEVNNYETEEKDVKDSKTVELEQAILAEKTSVVKESSHDTLDYDRNLQCTDAEGEPEVDYMYYDDIKHFDKYTVDDFPKNLDEPYMQKLKKRYKAIPEEFYTKSGLRPVRPENFNKWFSRMKGRGLRWHFWEWFSGSGRLSFIMMAAGLIVGFPVDLRYGWNVNDPVHISMLRRAQREFLPGVLHMAPDCGPWSVSGNLRPPELKAEDRKRDRNALMTVQEAAEDQSRGGRGYNVEQPYGSAMWKEDHECPLRLSEIYDHKGRQRCDQCMMGAQDEGGLPIQKATGFGSNFRWRRTSIRCSGHKGQPHSHLQGTAPDGLARTAKAAVYPREMCQRMKQDVVKFLHQKDLLKTSTWPRSYHIIEHFYECVRCQLGRSCPAGVEHTFVPGQCRHGRWAPGTGPRAESANAPADPIKQWKIRTNKEDLNSVKIDYDLTERPGEEHDHYLKKLLMEMVQTAMKTHGRKRSALSHWSESAFHMSLFKEIFKDTMVVKGIHVALHPFKKLKPDPQLATSSAYLRMMIVGTIKDWKIYKVEDLRELSFSQINEAVEFEDWMITVFGVEPGATPSPSTPGGHHRRNPPAPPLPPRQDDTFEIPEVLEIPEDRRPADIVGDGVYEDDQPQQPDRPEGEAEEEEFEPSDAAGQLRPIRPNYNLRRVLQKLPQLVAAGDNVKAKRLLLGLHERLWHSPINDYLNLLRRCGMDIDVLDLAKEAVQECHICRKFVRLPHRPQMRVGGAISFGDTLQIDLFFLNNITYLLMVDEATRFKMCRVLPGQDSEHIMEALMKSWIYLFGPPSRIVMDQQVSLMSHESGMEFERLNITRVPKGTTSGAAANQHTGTGIVERHVQLMKLTMLKLQAEMSRQGVTLENDEMAGEAAMAHNITLSYGGVTPAMCVFGTLPRGFYEEDGRGILSTSGALQTDLTTFERALRIRQAALAQCHQAINEDRIARASRSRPRQLDTQDLVMGTSEVEFYREVQGEPGGWRGPALLLRLDTEEGTAVIQYQGRPYLVSIRHIRPYRGIFMVSTAEPTAELSLLRLLAFVEQASQYKVHYIGWLRQRNGRWTHCPRNTSMLNEIIKKAETVSSSMSRSTLHGIMYGGSLRTFKPPSGTTGIMFTWIRGGREYAVQHHNSDHHVKMKKISNYAREEICLLYFYYYKLTEPEDNKEKRPMKEIADMPKMDTSDTTTKMNDMETETMDGDFKRTDKKRDGPETRTVVLAPEKKRQRNYFLEIDKAMDYMKEYLYYQNRNCWIKMDFPMSWRNDHNLVIEHQKTMLAHYYDEKRKSLPVLFNINYKHDGNALACLRTARIYKVDDETSNIDEFNLDPSIWNEVDKADEAEIRQFAEEKAFQKVHRLQITSDMVQVDGVWIRKRKRYPDGTLKMKSRMCARGCFDQQKAQLTTRSTTATKLSQRLAVSTAARKGLCIESLDIAGAFLKGYSFEAIQKALKKRGIQSPERKVIVFPPANVWRHLAKFDKQFDIGENNIHNYGLLCLKPVYGLNDAPLAWQLVLHEHIVSEGAIPSKLDENFFMWKTEGTHDGIYGVLTCHVDDLAIAGEQKWLNGLHDRMVQKFKKVSRQVLPFEHCGAEYSETKQGYCISQKAFVDRMKPADIPTRSEESDLTPDEVTSFRSILGALLWLTSTRLDLIAEVSFLQSKVTSAKVRDLKQANVVLKKAQEYKDLGIHYKKFKTDQQRLVCIHDASAASKGRNYAQEGVLVCMMDDFFVNEKASEWCSDEEALLHGGVAHVIYAHGCKAKRVSYSTSHGETLSMVNGLESSTLCMLRLAEMMHPKREPTIKDLISIQEAGHRELPMDFYGDCRDLYELITGERTLPQDKSQRLYILAIKEARLAGRIRYTSLVPTESMTADSLTKAMISTCMLLLLSAGVVVFRNEDGHAVQSRTVPTMEEIGEEDLLKTDEEIKEKMRTGVKSTTKTSTSSGMNGGMMNGDGAMAYRLKCLLAFSCTTTSMAYDMVAAQQGATGGNNGGSYTTIYVTIFVTMLVAIVVEKVISHGVGYIRDYLKEKIIKNAMVKVKEEALEPSTRKRKVMVDEHETIAMEVDRCSLYDKVEEEEREATTEELLRRLEEKEEYITAMTNSRDHYKELAQKNKETYLEWQDKEAKALDKFGEAMEDLAQTQDRVRYLDGVLKDKVETNRLNSTRMGNLQTKFNEKEKEYDRLQERYDTLIQRLHAGSDATAEVNRELLKEKEAVKALQKELDEKVTELSQKQAEINELQSKMTEKDFVLAAALVERDQKDARLGHAVEHNVQLQAELNVARAPERICYTPHGSVYHKPDCKHVQRSNGLHEMRKCRDCLP